MEVMEAAQAQRLTRFRSVYIYQATRSTLSILRTTQEDIGMIHRKMDRTYICVYIEVLTNSTAPIIAKTM